MEETNTADSVPSQPPETTMDQPVPMSFPAILMTGRNPHLAYLQQERLRSQASESITKGRIRENKEGKRWVRRKENAHFSFNPHITEPSSTDLNVSPNTAKATFPVPLPPYLPRTSPAPNSVLPVNDPSSTAAGHYSMSLRGVRKTLRRGGPRVESLVQTIDKELQDWLTNPIIKPLSDTTPAQRTIEGSPQIIEVSRTQAELVWNLEEDSFARYVVHATARFYGVVSFSKDHPEQGRLTHLLRPNVSRPNVQAMSTLATPPITDMDSGSEILVSERDLKSESSDVDSELGPLTEEDEWVAVRPEPRRSRLAEAEIPASDEDTGPRDDSPHARDGEESADENIAARLGTVTLDDSTPRANRRQPSERIRGVRAPLRSGSSPSRSPARRYGRSRHGPFTTSCVRNLRHFPSRPSRPVTGNPSTFYEYLFA